MDTLGTVLYFLGVGVLVLALIWSFVEVFSENPVLGILCLFLPFGYIVALCRMWPRSWRPLALWSIGFLFFFCGLVLLRPGE